MAKMSFTLIILIKLQFHPYSMCILLLPLLTAFFFLFMLSSSSYDGSSSSSYDASCSSSFSFDVSSSCHRSCSWLYLAVLLLPLQQKMIFFWKNPIRIIDPYDLYGLLICMGFLLLNIFFLIFLLLNLFFWKFFTCQLLFKLFRSNVVL